ncbi:MAG: hypothetical protein N4A38_05065 [Candidatus Gracilibacteria bacterium]|nr:hypothetical protein [Candidatus Gracilibacteria bacterium]
MESTIYSTEGLKNLFVSVLDTLTPKEQEVIIRRVGLNGQKETLQNIGDSFSITRERVRQIEDTGIKKIGRVIKTTDLIMIQNTAKEVLDLHGGLLTKDKLLNALVRELNLPKNVDGNIISIVLQSDYEIKKAKPKLGVKTYFYLPQISPKKINLVHKEMTKILKKKKDVVDVHILFELTKIALRDKYEDLTLPFIDSIVDIHEDLVKGEEVLVGLEKWKILNPKTLKDKAVYVLKKEKLPMHFVDISNKITEYLGDVVKTNTVHNELIRNEDFVLVGRGIYVLKEWGFKPGTVIDVIVEIMKKAGKPMTTDEITTKVLKVRNVKKTTIYMNLQNKDYVQRVGRNFYELKK